MTALQLPEMYWTKWGKSLRELVQRRITAQNVPWSLEELDPTRQAVNMIELRG
jgi:hypothetical protein